MPTSLWMSLKALLSISWIINLNRLILIFEQLKSRKLRKRDQGLPFSSTIPFRISTKRLLPSFMLCFRLILIYFVFAEGERERVDEVKKRRRKNAREHFVYFLIFILISARHKELTTLTQWNDEDPLFALCEAVFFVNWNKPSAEERRFFSLQFNI